MSRMTRRNLLNLLGLGGASYFLPSLRGGSNARASGPAVPRRIVFFYTEQGTLKPLWAPTAPGAPDALTITSPWSTSAHTLGELHQPLVPFQKRLLFLDGLDMESAWVDPTGATNSHVAGETHALVAADRATPELAGGPSIDQVIAKSINTPVPVTSLPSLELYVNAYGNDSGGEARPLYSGAGQPLPLAGDPGHAYDRIFPNGPQGATAAQKAALAAMLAQQKAVLEYAKNDFAAMGTRLGKVDRDRLTAHGAAVSDLESRLALGANAACAEPDRSIVLGTGFNQYELNADVLMRLAQTTLACDLARVVTLYVSVPPDDLFGYYSVQGTSDFHDMIHKTNGSNPPLANDPQAMAIVKKYHAYMASLYAKFLALLDSIPEPDGSTLLDNTLVVWCGQIAGGDHSLDHIPYVLAGSSGGQITPGRYVRYPRTPDANAWPTYSRGIPHNNLLLSLANLMGAPIQSFGNPQVCTGPLAGLT